MTANSYWATKPPLYTLRLKKECIELTFRLRQWLVGLTAVRVTNTLQAQAHSLSRLDSLRVTESYTQEYHIYTQHVHVRTLFLDVTPDGLAYSYRRLWEQQCLYLAGKARTCLKLFTSSHGVTSHKTKIFINTAARISNLSNRYRFAALQRVKPRIDSTGFASVGVTYGSAGKSTVCCVYTVWLHGTYL